MVWYFNMYSKQDLIDWYNDNIIKNKVFIIKQYGKRVIRKNILRIYQNILMKPQKQML